MKSQPKRDWSDARAKVDDEGRCRINSGCMGSLEAAHVIGRKCDEPRNFHGKTLYVHPDSVVPLCRRHHLMYDGHELDLLPYLTVLEQVRAVRDAEGIENARVRTCPMAYREVAC